MDLAALARAVNVLMSPLEWGNRDAWLRESLRHVRDACGHASPDPKGDPRGELEAFLRLPDDKPGWLTEALDDPEAGLRAKSLPPTADVSEALLPILSLRYALVAGLGSLQQLRSLRNTLGQAFDDVETGMAIFGDGGTREVGRNARLEELLNDEPDRDRLLDIIARQAARAATAAGTAREEGQDLELAGGSYRLVTSRATAGTLLHEPAVLILVDRLNPGLPTTRELRVSFGLRGREPQVALLAAEGLSNADIAERLRLSSHTVRHYLERVLDRLDLHSRKALALHLMTGNGDAPPGPVRKPRQA
jgi:DNA-binding CsgD family transcriptional regulator